MNTAASYARALQELVEKTPKQSKVYLKNLRHALKARGHEKLLPRILSEYQKLELQKERREMYRAITPQMERARILLQLYRKLLS